MKKVSMDIKEVQSRILDIVKYVDQICKENNLTYYLSGGTMLGAVREKGFIPWDDDADLMLPRKDYMKLIEIMSKQEGARYRLGDLSTTEGWSLPFAKVYDSNTEIEYAYINETKTGIYIDIFPMDGIPSSKLMTKLYFLIVKSLWVFRHAAIKKEYNPKEHFRGIKNVLRKIAPKVGAYRISKWIDKFAKRRDFEKSEYVGVGVLCHYMSKERFKKSDFDHAVDRPFESESFPVPVGYHNYLSSLYGDYMKRPEVQESHHHITVYVKE